MKRLFCLFIAGSLCLLAADFWKGKPASDWNEKEVKRFLTHSPWVKEVTPAFKNGGAGAPGMSGPEMGGGGPSMGGGGGMGGGMGGGGGMSGPGGGGMGGPGMGGGPPGGGSGPGGGTMPKATVQWASAEPVREALARTGVAIPKEWAETHYAITVSGLPMAGRPGAARGGSNSEPDSERMRGIEERLRASTSLKRHDKDPIAPARVERLATETGAVLVFLFPRAAAIDADDKDVAFQCGLGHMEIKAKFELKDMVYGGKLSL